MTRVARSIALVPLLLALALLLAACGGGTDEPGDAGADTTPAQGADASAGGEGDQDASSGAGAEGTPDGGDATTSADNQQEDNVADKGDTVSVHYEGKLDNGEVFDSSRQREPLQFEVGAGQVIPGFDHAVEGMTVGETKTVRLEPEQAYGERREDLILSVPKEQAPDGLSEGDMVQLSNGAPATVVDVSAEAVTIDANHQLAGEALTFDIELVGVQ